MDSAKLTAARDLQKMSRMMEGIIALGPDLEQLGNMEQAITTLKETIANLTKDKEALEGANATARANSAALTERSRREFRDMEVKGKQLIAEAQATAGQMVSDARSSVGQIRADAEETKRQLNEQIAALTKTKTDLEGEVVKVQEQLDKVRKEMVAVRERIATIAQ